VSSLKHLFTDHPSSVDETYTEHMGSAWHFSCQLFIGAVLCSVHAILPFLLQDAASRRVKRLHEEMVTHRSRWRSLPAAESVATGVQTRTQT